jgi:hypothetical protein
MGGKQSLISDEDLNDYQVGLNRLYKNETILFLNRH